ncbi:hypothetical protein AMR72_06260 [Flavobacterium psychrophilum]|nr:hypothetical protein AMR72_06260 [Flavobacterium psychrophilum]AOE52155.1 hypothetical protein ALW18_06250 [Flavobacterium psychrophilum]
MLKITHIYRFGLLQKALFCLGLFLALGTTGAFAQFAVTEDFRGSGNPDIIIGDDAALTSGNADPVNQGWLRLTNSDNYKKGSAYVNKSFPSSLGVLVDFEFKMWRNKNADGADGIGVFLFDGTSAFKLGGNGGSMGYTSGNGSATGLAGGYVGIGLDAYGNFANPVNGPKRGGPAGNGVEAVRANAVIMRGPTTTNNTDNVVNGVQPTNRYLAGSTITVLNNNNDNNSFSFADAGTSVNNDRAQNALDYNTNVTTRPADNIYYRRIQIEIERLSANGIYRISVRWKIRPDVNSPFRLVTSYITTDVPPALLKLGFSASTGGDINFHEIRNLLVTTPNNIRVIKRGNKEWLRGLTSTNSATNQIQYTIEINNDTDMQVDNIKFEDYLTNADGGVVPFVTNITTPGGFLIESITPSGFVGNPQSASFTRDNAAGKISHNLLSIAANGIAYVTVTGRLTGVPTGNLLKNKVVVTPQYDTDMNNNTSIVETPVLAEGADVTAVNIVDHTCSDGSNLFTIRAASVGTDGLIVGTGNNSARLKMVITLPASTGFSIGSYNFDGWDVVSQSTNNGLATYTLLSNQSQTITSGNSYSYPIIFTINKTTPYTAYSTTAVSSYINSSGNNIESPGNTTNNTSVANVYAIPLPPTVSNVYYCQGSTPLQLTATRNPNNASTSGYTLKWYFSESGGFSSDFAPTPSTEAGGIQSFWVSQVNGTCEGPRARIDVYVSPTPTPGTISGNQNICSGTTPGKISNVTAGNNGSAAGLTFGTIRYRWQYSDDNGENWIDISNSNSPEYTPPSAITATRQYQRITISRLTNNGINKDCESSGSNPVTVTVSAPTPGMIGTNQTVCYNTAPNSITTASGAGNAPTGAGTLSYIWEHFPSNATNWSTLTGPGTSGESYLPPVLTVTTRYRRSTVSNSTVSGNSRTCTSGVSNIVTITVQGIVNPGGIAGDQSICPGATPTALTSTTPGSSSTAGAAITYRWESSTNAGGTWGTAAGTATNIDYTFSGGVSLTTYYRRITISTLNGKACEAPSGNVIISVVSPTPGTIGNSQTVCFGTAPTLFTTVAGFAATGAGNLTYQWYESFNNVDFNPISNANLETYQEPNNLTINKYYRRVTFSNTNGTSCQSVFSNTITVTAAAFLGAGGLVDDNKTVCSGGTPTTIQSQSPGTGTAPITYAWQSSTDNITYSGDIAGQNGPTYSPGPLTQNTWFRRYTIGTYNSGTTTCRSSSPTNAIKVTVAPIATPGKIKSSQTVCNGTAPQRILNDIDGTDTNGGYIWQVSSVTNPTWTNIAGETTSSYQPPIINVTTSYRRIGVSNSSGVLCPGTEVSNVVTMTVPSVPTNGKIGYDQNVCNNAIPALLTSVEDGTGGTGYQWQVSDNGTDGWSNIAGATSSTYQPGVATYTRFYRRLTINNTCPSSGTNVVRILVNTYPNSGSISGTQSVCTGNKPADLTGDSGWAGGGTGTYRWYSSTNGTTWNFTGVTAQNYVFSDPIAATTLYRRGLTSSPCYGEVFTNTVTVTVSAAPTGGTIALAQTVCYGAVPNPLTSSQPGSVANYRWESSPNGSANSWSNTGVTTEGYTFSAGLNQTTHYRRVTISTTCVGEAYSNTIIITVAAQVSAGSVGSNQIICYNTVPATLQPSGSTSTTNYRWDSSPSGNANTWTPTGVTTADFKFTAPLTQTTYYRRATISGSCEAYATPVVITVMSRVEEGSISGDQNICMDTAPARIGPGTQGSGQGDITYKWESQVEGSTNWTVIAGASEASYLPPVIRKTTQYRRTTISTSVINGFTSKCESASTTGTVVVTVRNCKVITNPMIYQKVKN